MVRSKAASYAIMAMVEIAERTRGEQPSDLQAGEIAGRLGLPMAYTAKVLSQLARASLLRSDRGPRGGFQLAREPDQISLLQILQAVGAWSEGELPLPEAASPKVRRSVNEAIQRAVRQAHEVLDSVYLSSLVTKDQPVLQGAGAPS